jgi:hypothetical protein
MGVMFTGDPLGKGDGCVDNGSIDDSSINGGSDEGDDVVQETQHQEAGILLTVPHNSTSHRLFLVRLAGGDLGGCDSVVGSMSSGWVLSVGALAVGALAVGAQAVMVVEGQHWRRRQRLRMFVTVVCIRKRQKSVTSCKPVMWLTEACAAWPVVMHM